MSNKDQSFVHMILYSPTKRIIKKRTQLVLLIGNSVVLKYILPQITPHIKSGFLKMKITHLK